MTNRVFKLVCSVAALALKDKHSFKADMDEAAKLAMFPHLGVKVA